uniref:Uncharacterized protein n=1 Tax=Onchocerca volvulus TaxID=6282 RepID=A0A8R1Y0V5_ONCVO
MNVYVDECMDGWIEKWTNVHVDGRMGEMRMNGKLEMRCVKKPLASRKSPKGRWTDQRLMVGISKKIGKTLHDRIHDEKKKPVDEIANF